MARGHAPQLQVLYWLLGGVVTLGLAVFLKLFFEAAKRRCIRRAIDHKHNYQLDLWHMGMHVPPCFLRLKAA